MRKLWNEVLPGDIIWVHQGVYEPEPPVRMKVKEVKKESSFFGESTIINVILENGTRFLANPLDTGSYIDDDSFVSTNLKDCVGSLEWQLGYMNGDPAYDEIKLTWEMILREYRAHLNP